MLREGCGDDPLHPLEVSNEGDVGGQAGAWFRDVVFRCDAVACWQSVAVCHIPLALEMCTLI